MKPIPHRHRAVGKREIRRRLDRPVTAPAPNPVVTASNVQYEVADKTRAVACGGIGAIQLLVRQRGLAEAIDGRPHLLEFHSPDHESDHVLNRAYNALCDGTCLDGVELRRNDVVLLDALGADRIPDPTTAGDFRRRSTAEDVETLRDVLDQTRLKLWRQPPPEFFDEAILDVDGALVATGAGRERGVDIAYDGTRGYHPLIISPADAGAVLGIVNRPGNRPPHEGAAERLDLATLLCREAGFRRLVLRGDTDFTRAQRLDAWDAEGVTFPFGIDAMPDLKALAEALPASDRTALQRPPRSTARGEPRRRPGRVKDRVVRQRGFETLTRLRGDVAEGSHRPTACQESFRLIIVRQTIAVGKGRARLFDEIRGRFYLTNDRRGTPRGLAFEADDRCDQENRIAQPKGGAHALRAAVDNPVSNWASMVMTALAWDLKAWFALSVPERPRHRAAHREQERQLRRTEFKRFVNAIILMPCRIARGGRRLIYRLLSWDEWQGVFLRVVYASRCRGDDESEPGSGRPGPQGPRELRGRRGGDDGTAGPATMRRHPASPITVRSVSMGAGSSSASLKPRLFKV